MSSLIDQLAYLREIPIIFLAKFRAADAAADLPPTHRRRTADIAADTAADACSPQRPESVFPDPSHMIAYRQNIAP